MYCQKLTAVLLLSVHEGSLILARQGKEPLFEGYIQSSDGSLLVVSVPLEVLNGSPVGQPVAGRAVTVVVAVQPLQPLHLLDDLHRVFLYQVLVGQHVLLLVAAVEFCAGQDVGDGPESGK